MRIIQILLLGIPIFYFIIIYLKKDKEEQEELRGTKSPSSLLDEGLRFIGFAVFFSGLITSIAILQHIGAIMIFIGWFSGGIQIWDESIKKSVLLMSFGVIGIVTYYFLVI
ncbi:hypothetical protein ACFPYN_12620 [Paenisporosarcina macmurdoensis]|uniref:DUF4181 domain-containing protein n=1 Tax=Paenisporosarcina macmurdoensis TaxID=212659 RepID=A0ABW1LBB2_9BACL